jgi:hypothetical protein
MSWIRNTAFNVLFGVEEKELYRQAVVDEDLFNALMKSDKKLTPFYEALERR